MIRSEEEGDDGLPIISNSIPARSVMGVSDLDKQAGICQSRMPGFSYIPYTHRFPFCIPNDHSIQQRVH